MVQTTRSRIFLLAVLILPASALCVQAKRNGNPAPSADTSASTLKSSITLDTGVTFPALPGQSLAGGQVSFTAPFIEGQARTNLRGIVHMKFPRSRDEKRGAYTVRLVNGDRIVGNLVTLDEDILDFDTDMLGRLEIPRDIVRTITRRGKSSVLIDSTFATDGFDTWRIGKGEWMETNKGLRTSPTTASNILLCRAPHDGPITLVADLDASMNPKPSSDRMTRFQVEVTLFTPTPAPDWRLDSLKVSVGSLRSSATLRSNQKPFSVRGASWPEGKGELRIAYDPGTFTIKVWANEKCLINFSLDDGPKTGQYVSISSYRLLNLQSVRMYCGIVPPGVNDTAPVDDTEGILLVNGDRLDAGELEIEDERAIAHTPNGNEFKLDLDKISYIVMRKNGRRTLPHRGDDIRVRLQETSLRLKLDKLTDTELTGNSAGLGDLSIRRAALAAIECDLLGKKRAAADALKVKNRSIVTLVNGTVLPATVGNVDDDVATISAPWLAGVARIKLLKLARLDLLHVARPEPGNEMLFLTDGSQVACSLQKITGDAFELRTGPMGSFRPARKFVQSVCTNQEAGLLSAADFSTGTMGKWKPVGGQWKLQRNGLLSVHNSGPRGIVLPLSNADPITVEIVVRQSPHKPPIFAQLGFCASKPSTNRTETNGLSFKGLLFNFGQQGIKASCSNGTRATMQYVNMNNPAVRPFVTPEGEKIGQEGTVTIAWDPITKIATAWGDGRFLASATIKAGPRKTSYIMLGAYHNGLVFESVRIWKGLVAAGANDKQAAADTDVVVDRQGKATEAGKITLADGKLRIRSDTGDRSSPLTELSTILMARNARTVVRRAPDHVRLGLARSVILLRLKSMDAEFLEGVSPTLGSVRIPRDAIRWIEIKVPGQR